MPRRAFPVEKIINLLRETEVVSDLARQIREFYADLSRRDGKPGLTTPDAVHLVFRNKDLT
jgi:hypothetical protein